MASTAPPISVGAGSSTFMVFTAVFLRRSCAWGAYDTTIDDRTGDDAMKPSLQPGVSRVTRIAIDKARTIAFMGEEGRVYATPYLIGDIEMTCRHLILEHADDNEDSVGTEVAIKHLR